MTPQMRKTAEDNLQVDLDRLTYSAYLLTLDPGVALSVVMTAIDGLLEEIAHSDLLERTVKLALQQLRHESNTGWFDESSAFDAVFDGHSAAVDSQAFQSLQNLSGNPILLLDSSSRIAFVLHHVLGYKIREAAAMAQVDEKKYRAQLRKAYLKLVSFRSEGQALAGDVLEDSGLG